MDAKEIFTPIAVKQIERGQRVTNKQIYEDTGIPQARVRVLKECPERATLEELEILTNIYNFSLKIGG